MLTNIEVIKHLYQYHNSMLNMQLLVLSNVVCHKSDANTYQFNESEKYPHEWYMITTVRPLLFRSKKCNAELVFFVRYAMFLHFGITITQLSAKYLIIMRRLLHNANFWPKIT